jgi:hypothetical protein
MRIIFIGLFIVGCSSSNDKTPDAPVKAQERSLEWKRDSLEQKFSLVSDSIYNGTAAEGAQERQTEIMTAILHVNADIRQRDRHK